MEKRILLVSDAQKPMLEKAIEIECESSHAHPHPSFLSKKTYLRQYRDA